MRRARVLEAHGRKAGRQEVPGQSVLEENETLSKEGEGRRKKGEDRKSIYTQTQRRHFLH